MTELRRRGLVKPILAAIDSGKPLLGICLGLQLLFETGYENGRHQGLGVLPGEVVRFELPAEYTVPHMGWNQLAIRRPPRCWKGWPRGPTSTSSTRITWFPATRAWWPPRPTTAGRSAR